MESDMPLFQKNVLVTRGKTQAAEFSQKISAAGGIPIEIPLLAFQQPNDHQLIFNEIRNLHTYSWLVFTSKNGVDYFFEFYREVYGKENKPQHFPKIAVVGSKTKKALVKYGYQPDLVPEEYVAEGLFDSLEPYITPKDRVLLARGNLSRSFLVEKLLERGAAVTDLVVYETVEDTSDKTELLKLLQAKKIDIVTFTSPSTVNQFYNIVESTDWRDWTKDTIFACIGPQTKLAAEKVDIPIHVCPNTYTIDDLLKEIESYLRIKEEI